MTPGTCVVFDDRHGFAVAVGEVWGNASEGLLLLSMLNPATGRREPQLAVVPLPEVLRARLFPDEVTARKVYDVDQRDRPALLRLRAREVAA